MKLLPRDFYPHTLQALHTCEMTIASMGKYILNHIL